MTPAPAPPPGAFQAAVEPVAALATEAGWDALVARAAGANPFYARAVIGAHRSSGLCPARLTALTVREEGTLVALLPFVLRPDVAGLGARLARPFLSPYMTASGPLVAEGPGFEERLDALVAGLALASGGRAWRWPLLPREGRVGAGLRAALERAGWQVGCVRKFARPVLDRRSDYDSLLAGHPHRGRFKDLRRRRRRLEEMGALRLETASEGAALARAVETFLALEAAGWKGEAGTALRSHPRTERFARDLFQGRDGPVRIRADVLWLEHRPEKWSPAFGRGRSDISGLEHLPEKWSPAFGKGRCDDNGLEHRPERWPPAFGKGRCDDNGLERRAVAASLALICGGTATLLKIAYDEALRAQAPGLVLEDAIVRALHAEGFAERLDSATMPGSVLESLYPERETIDEIIAVPPGAGLIPLERRLGLARLAHRAKDEAKRLLRRT